MEEEPTFNLDLDQDVEPPKTCWVNQVEEDEIQEQLEPMDQNQLGVAEISRTSSKTKEACTTVVKKKKKSFSRTANGDKKPSHNPT
jgi:hypothetical protein